MRVRVWIAFLALLITALPAKSLTGGNSVGKVAFGTEGGLYQEAGIPTVICGPGSISQAHKPDEFIEVDQIAQCEAFMDRLMDRVCRLPAGA